MFLGSHGAVPAYFWSPFFQRAAALQDGIWSELGGRKPRLNQPTPSIKIGTRGKHRDCRPSAARGSTAGTEPPKIRVSGCAGSG